MSHGLAWDVPPVPCREAPRPLLFSSSGNVAESASCQCPLSLILVEKCRQLEKRIEALESSPRVEPAVTADAQAKQLDFEITPAPKMNVETEDFPQTLQMQLEEVIDRQQEPRVEDPELPSTLDPKGDLDEYRLECGMWDATLLFDVKFLGRSLMLKLSGIMLLYLMVLATFLAVVFTRFGDNDFDEDGVAELSLWRTQEGHSLHQMANGRSLVSRLCSGDPSLAIAARQADSWEAVTTYLGDESYFNGAGMSLAALVVWMLILGREVKRILRFAFGVQAVKRDFVTRIIQDGEAVTIASLGSAHLVFICVAASLRVGSALVLMYAGTLFIVHEVGLEEILLNCAALEIVLTLDQLVFEVLVPEGLIRVVDKTVPLRYKRTATVKSLSLFARVGFVTMAILVGPGRLFLFWQDLERVKSTMCGGELNFVYERDAMGVVHARATNTHVDLPEGMTSFIEKLQGTFHTATAEENDGITAFWRSIVFQPVQEEYPSQLFWQRVRSNPEWRIDGRFELELFLLQRADVATGYPSGDYSLWHCVQTTAMHTTKVDAFDRCFRMTKDEYCQAFVHLCHTSPMVTVSCPEACGCYSPFTRPDIPDVPLPGEPIPLCPGAYHDFPNQQWKSWSEGCADFPAALQDDFKLAAYDVLRTFVTYPDGSPTQPNSAMTVGDLGQLLVAMILRYLFPALPYGKNFAAQVHTLSVFLRKENRKEYDKVPSFVAELSRRLSGPALSIL
eukprot:TRINITY_DN27018_c0_g1_i1.p1 TRINITY_DN27018_c0_g1~~TRINITY_DN27018_c0_g1_i1.p1  ORF type:complete len:733 (-),score=100.18 TRINITY_DN27018_c0_g1_i1:859-3057(-)